MAWAASSPAATCRWYHGAYGAVGGLDIPVPGGEQRGGHAVLEYGTYNYVN